MIRRPPAWLLALVGLALAVVVWWTVGRVTLPPED